jgi:putative glycosyltransferase (TIGR04348 family)
MRGGVRIALACPAPAGSRTGNRATAERWRRLLRELGHDVQIVRAPAPRSCDLLVALHATHSAEAVERFRARSARAPVIVALAGTDLYLDLERDRRARRSLERATRIVALHARAPERLPAQLRARTRVIEQSADAPARPARRRRRSFDVAVVAHLRDVKDPFRAEEAVRALPSASRLRVLHAGGELQRGMARQARQRAAANPRYLWLGELAPGQARRLIARSRLLVLSSRLEGGANVISEAVVAGVPVLATRIPCCEALLGAGYPGLFTPGRTRELRALLKRAEDDAAFRRLLERRCRSRRRLFAPARERAAWRRLLREVTRERARA